MQTIKVNTKKLDGDGFALRVGRKVIASVHNDSQRPGRFYALFAPWLPFGDVKTKLRYPEAVEFVTGAIERHFAAFGLDVEFVNA